jgi:hypothetical protein
MMTSKRTGGFGRTLIVLGLAGVFPLAHAQQVGGGIAVVPENSVSIGLGLSSGDQNERARFGLFNGLRSHDTNALLGFNYSNRENESG